MKRFTTILIVAAFSATIFAEPDLSDMVSQNMKSIGGGGHLSTHFRYYEDDGYELRSFGTSAYFSYESFFANRWSFRLSPSFGVWMYDDDDGSLSIDASVGINRYFGESGFIPYVHIGLSSDYYLRNHRNRLDISPKAAIGFVREIRDRFYLDVNLRLPTFVGLKIDENGADFGLRGFSTPISFGFKYYY